jgi:hypothetical protein
MQSNIVQQPPSAKQNHIEHKKLLLAIVGIVHQQLNPTMSSSSSNK